MFCKGKKIESRTIFSSVQFCRRSLKVVRVDPVADFRLILRKKKSDVSGFPHNVDGNETSSTFSPEVS